MTHRTRRLLTLALLPCRAAVTAFCAYAAWVNLASVGDPITTTGSMAGDIAVGAASGLTIGILIVCCAVVAVAAWTPLPPAQPTTEGAPHG